MRSGRARSLARMPSAFVAGPRGAGIGRAPDGDLISWLAGTNRERKHAGNPIVVRREGGHCA